MSVSGLKTVCCPFGVSVMVTFAVGIDLSTTS